MHYVKISDKELAYVPIIRGYYEDGDSLYLFSEGIDTGEPGGHDTVGLFSTKPVTKKEAATLVEDYKTYQSNHNRSYYPDYIWT